MRRGIYLAITIPVILALLGACAPTTPTVAPTKPAPAPAAPTIAPKLPALTPTAAPKIKRGGTLSVAIDSTPRTMDFQLSTGGGGPFYGLVFDTLIQHVLVDEKASRFELQPRLAESWKIVNPTTIDLALRKGVKFHDDSAFNAEVAKFNLERMINHPKSTRSSSLVAIASVESVDDYTIRLRLKEPSATMLLQLSSGGYSYLNIMSKAALDKMGEEYIQSNPVGTGPMRLDRWDRDDRVTLRRFEGYWDKGADGQPLPYLDRFVERYIPDKSVALLELRAGNLDVTTFIDAKDVAAVKASPDLVYQELPWRAWFYNVFFNPKKEPYASNIKLRQAAYHSIDREGLIRALGFGVGRPYLYPFWVPGNLGYDDKLPYYEFDLAKAKRLLGEAGYPQGIDVGLNVIQRSAEVRMSEAVKAMLDVAGIRTTVSIMERTAWVQAAVGFQYDLGMNRPSVRADPDLQGAELLCKAPGNWSSYCNPELDKCMAGARSEYDEAKRAEIYKRCQRLIYEDAAFGTTFFIPENIVYSKKVKDLAIQFSSDRVDARRAWLDR